MISIYTVYFVTMFKLSHDIPPRWMYFNPDGFEFEDEEVITVLHNVLNRTVSIQYLSLIFHHLALNTS